MERKRLMVEKLNGKAAADWWYTRFAMFKELGAIEREVAAWERIGLSLYVKKGEWYRIAA